MRRCLEHLYSTFLYTQSLTAERILSHWYRYCIGICIVLVSILYWYRYCIGIGIVLVSEWYWYLYCISICIVLVSVLYRYLYCIGIGIVLVSVLYWYRYCISICIVSVSVLYRYLYCIGICMVLVSVLYWYISTVFISLYVLYYCAVTLAIICDNNDFIFYFLDIGRFQLHIGCFQMIHQCSFASSLSSTRPSLLFVC